MLPPAIGNASATVDQRSLAPAGPDQPGGVCPATACTFHEPTETNHTMIRTLLSFTAIAFAVGTTAHAQAPAP
eukprot:gene4632-5920_t